MIETNINLPQRFGFIPNKLEVEGRPELSNFPLNILFANFFALRGVNMSATALYEPDTETYLKDMEKRSMVYRNKYGPENEVVVTRYEDRWEGAKTVDGKVVLLANGKTWKQFFVQLTVVGLSNGEKCYYETIPLPKTVN